MQASPFGTKERKRVVWNEQARRTGLERIQYKSTVGRDVKMNSVASQKKVFVVLLETVNNLVDKRTRRLFN
jgi:hypothetical protein